MNAFPFATTVTLSPEETEIREWIKINRVTLADRAPNEVAELAVFCGFDLKDVCRTLSNFRDAMDGSHIDNRLAFEAWRLDMAIADVNKMRDALSRPKELDLSPLWKSVTAYYTGD